MNSVSPYCCNPPDQFSPRPANWTYQSAQIEKALITGEQSTDIEIQTADGDKVTLSSNVQFESSAMAYEQLNRTRSRYSESQGQLISAEANSTFELTVEGTLDEEEKKDIKEVLMNLFEMIKDFITGKADTEKAQNFTDLTTISNVKAEFDIKARVTVAAQSSANYVAQSPTIPQAETAYQPAVSKRVDKLTDQMIAVVKDSGVEPSKILNRLNRRLSGVSRKFMNDGSARWHNMHLIHEIMKDFIKKLEKLSAENGAGINKAEVDEEKAPNIEEPAVVETTSSAAETILNSASQDFHFEMEYSVADSIEHRDI